MNLLVIEDILQGRVQSPTGGESPRIPSDRDRSGVIPGPTVKVWMEEEFLVDVPFFGRVIIIDFLIPALLDPFRVFVFKN